MEKGLNRRKRAGFILAVIVLLLAVVIGMFHDAIRMTFCNLTVQTWPMPAVDDWPDGRVYLNVPYAEVSDSDYLNLYVPDTEEKPQLFVLIHGGGFIAGTAETKQTWLMYRYFRDHGYACATVNYRLAQEAPFPAAIEDCKAAIRFLRANADKYGYDAETVAVFGESAGGYLASMCAFTTDTEFSSLAFLGQTEGNNPSARVECLVDYYPFCDLTGLSDDLKAIGLPSFVYRIANGWMDGQLEDYEDFASYWLRKNVSEMTQAEIDAASPMAYLEKNAVELSGLSVYLIHGDCDITVPLPSSERLYQALQTSLGFDRVLFRVVAKMGHASDPLYADGILEEIDSFLKARLA